MSRRASSFPRFVSFVAALALLGLAESRSAQGAEPASGEVAAPLIKLLDPGSGATRTLRFVPEKGGTQTAIMSLRMSMTMNMGGMPMPAQKLPTQELTLEVKVDDVAANGDIRYTFKFAKAVVKEEAGVQPVVMEAMKSQLQNLVGLEGVSTVTNRGVAKDLALKIPETASPQVRQVLESMKQSMQQVSAPVPEEAVGVGAKWEVTQVIVQNAVKIRQVAQYEVLSLDGDTVKLKTDMQQRSGEKQDMKAPGMPAGAKLTLISLDSKGSGETVVDLRRLLPKDAELTVKNETKMELGSGDQVNAMNTRMEMQVSMKEKP